MFNFAVVGCGIAGMVISRALVEKKNKILIVDKRNYMVGNIYNYYNKEEI